MTPEFLFVGGREVREVPKGWQHPKDASGRCVPLLPFGYQFDEDQERVPTMPPPLGDVEVVAYETTTEGTPFPATPEGRLALVTWCAEHCTTFGDHRADAEAWAAILFGDAAVSLDGRVVGHD